MLGAWPLKSTPPPALVASAAPQPRREVQHVGVGHQAVGAQHQGGRLAAAVAFILFLYVMNPDFALGFALLGLAVCLAVYFIVASARRRRRGTWKPPPLD
jgi:hypothetical protein